MTPLGRFLEERRRLEQELVTTIYACSDADISLLLRQVDDLGFSLTATRSAITNEALARLIDDRAALALIEKIEKERKLNPNKDKL